MYGPSLPSTSRLRSRMLANVPRIITSWWPRRAPYELNSSGATPCAWSHWPAGDHGGDRAGRRDVVGRDRVAEDGQDARPVDVADRRGLGGHAVEERRPGDVGRGVVPGVAVAGGDRQRPPAVVALEDDRVGRPEQLGLDRRADDRADLVGRRPDVGQEDRPAVVADPERLAGQVDVDAAGEGERDDERRRGEVARPGQRMDPALEVAVARQDGGDDEVVLLDRLWRPARRAGRSCRCRSCSRSRRARSRAARAAPSARPPRGSRSRPSSPGASDVLTVGADRSPRATAFRASSPAPTMTVGFEVFVHDVIAAIATEPGADRRALPADLDRDRVRRIRRQARPRRPSAPCRRRRRPWPSAGRRPGSRRGARPAGRGPAAGAARRPTARRIARSSSRSVVELGPGPGSRHRPCVLRVALDEVDELRRSGRSGGGRRASRRRSGRASTVAPNSGLMLAIVARSASDSPASPSPANSTNAPTTPKPRSSSVTTRTRSVAVEPCGSSPWSRTPTIRGIGW